MKRIINFLICGAMVLGTYGGAIAQFENDSRVKSDSRLDRDIAVAENVLNTLIKQEFSKRNFFPVNVKGTYRSGYGATFIVPTDMLSPMVWGSNDIIMLDGAPGSYAYSFSTSPEPDRLPVLETETAKDKAISDRERNEARIAKTKATEERERVAVGGGVKTRSKKANRDSISAVVNAKIVEVAKNFLADYGDLLSELKPEEKVIVTNRSENSQHWYWNQNEKRSILVVEALKGDLTAFRQGKISREQLLAKIKVTNTESSGQREPDLEVLTSAFSRLYDSELSSTYFMQGNSFYERLNDFGAIVYMQVYSSNQTSSGLLNMPTVNLREVDQETRDKKVKELYPAFEKELKENILQYGSLVRSLKDNEQLVFNVALTKCKGCGIPSDIEVSAPLSVLRDYSSGKMDKNSALSKITVKKGAGQ